jgi:hypothetical protein
MVFYIVIFFFGVFMGLCGLEWKICGLGDEGGIASVLVACSLNCI